MSNVENKRYAELQKRYDDLETLYLLEREEHRKVRNHLMSVLNSKSFKTGKTILYIPHHGALFIKGNKNKLRRALKKIYKINKKGTLRVGVIARDGTIRPTSSAFLRLISPLTYGKTGREIQTELLPDNTRTATDGIDVCIVQRTAVDNLGSARTLVKDLKDKKVKLVIDTDDNFGGLDPSHPQHKVHADAVNALNYLKKHADRIWVSTDKLAEDYKSKRTIMRNSFDDRLWHLQKRPILRDHKIKVVYMGTGTHDKDFAMILPALDKVNNKYNNAIELTVLGVASKELPQREWLRFKPTNMMYPYFVRWFQKQGPFDIGIAPLEETEFNKAKSDIKVLDYLSIGVLPVVSDIIPYQNSELENFIVKVGYGSEDWYKKLEDIIQNREDYSRKKAESIPSIERYLYKDRSTSIVSQQVLLEIKSITASE